jgi:hypothetical protein
MPKTSIKRFFYRNGQTHMEIRALAGNRHGTSRTWNHNGQLVEELRFRHGLMHGISRQWNAQGRRLGYFKMNHGTGTQRYWHDNGRLKMEIDSRDGQFHGRTRMWLCDGTLIREEFHIQNVTVSRADYLKAARDQPDWPQYAAQPAGRVSRASTSLKRKELQLLIESILDRDHAEARQWLTAEQCPDRRSLAKFRTPKAALRFVETLYAAGAEAVIAAPIFSDRSGKLFADWLLIQLPKVAPKRNTLLTICQEFCCKRGGAVLPDKDIGECHLFLRLE